MVAQVLSVAERLNLAGLKAYQAPLPRMAAWQAGTTFGAYLAVVAAMYGTVGISVWMTLALAVPASGLIVRFFSKQNGCAHGSLFRGRRVNAALGGVCSLVTLTPFAYWRRLHARHHGDWNNLDARGVPADFFSDCITVAEYGAMSPRGRWVYRLTHHPLLVHLVLPPVIFMLVYRVPFDTPASCRRERVSVVLLDLGLAALYGALVWAFGWRAVLLVQGPAIVLASIVGIWLFSVQHRFEDAQWSDAADWRYDQAAVHGTSYLKLPRVLQWFSGNIGLHHVHHLRPGIPNYRLQACHDGCQAVTGEVTVLTLREALGAPSFALWDEALGRMVRFPR